MKRFFSITMAAFLLVACGGSNNNDNNANNTAPTTPQEKQLNISILLDLSDRINPKINPNAQKNDIENIKTITEFFRTNMKRLNAYDAKGKIRVFLIPPPNDADINSTVSKLIFDCSEMKNEGRKKVYDNLTNLYTQNLDEIYKETIATSTWQEGSDIWGFFKDGVHRCIEKDTNYRNILIIFTNGYLWATGHIDTKLTNTTSIQPKYLTKWHSNPDSWDKEKESINIKPMRDDLQDLEILVLGIKADSPKNKIDEDILIFLWGKWFKEMGVKEGNYKILTSDLPSTLETDIKYFLNSK